METPIIQPLIFELTNESEIQSFEEALTNFVKTFNTFYPKHFSLAKIYTLLKGSDYKNPSRIFTACVDLQISFIYIHLDLITSAGYNNFINREFTIRKNSGQELSLKEALPSLLNIHQADTSYYLRYRALWDKLMGILFLIFCPEKYDNYISSRSKIRYFTNHLLADPKVKNVVTNVWTEHAGSLSEMLKEFENKFRTPEIHGSGALRKYAFIVDPEDRLILSTNYWNSLNDAIMKFGKIFNAP